jgi:hypothetical protein
MATILITGFEAGDATEAVGSTGTFSVQGTTKRTGQYALQCNPASSTAGNLSLGAWAATGATANIARTLETFYTFYVRFAAIPSGTTEFVVCGTASASPVARCRITSGGAVTLAGATTSATVATLVSGTWYRFDMRVTSNSTCGLAIDGGTEQTCTGNNLNQDRLYLGRTVTSEAFALDVCFDDVLINTTGFPGAGEVRRLDPDGNGNYTGWASGTGVTFAEVDDDVPGHDSDTTYVKALDTGDNTGRTFSLESSASASVAGTITAVSIYGVVRSESITGTSVVGLRARNGSTDIDTSGQEWGTVYLGKGLILDTDPNGGGAWTSGGLDTLEAGVFAGTLAQAQRCTKVAAMVWCAGTGVQDVSMNTIASTTALNNMTITPGAVAVGMNTISPATVLNNLSVAYNVSMDTIASALQLHSMAVTPGSVAVGLNSIAAATSVNDMAIASVQSIVLDVIASTTALHELTVSPGAVTIELNAIAATTSVNNLTVTPGTVAVVMETIASVAALHELTITPGAVEIALNYIDPVTALYELTIPLPAASIGLETIAATTTLYEPTVLYVVDMGTVDPATTLYDFEVTPGAVNIDLDTILANGTLYAFHINAGPGVHFTDMVVGQPQLTIVNGQALLSWLVMQPVLSAQSLQPVLDADVDQAELDVVNEH